MSSDHRLVIKNFETELWVNDKKLPLNHFVQEALANTIEGFLQTLKETPEPLTNIKIIIRKLDKPIDVDTHTYP